MNDFFTIASVVIILGYPFIAIAIVLPSVKSGSWQRKYIDNFAFRPPLPMRVFPIFCSAYCTFISAFVYGGSLVERFQQNPSAVTPVNYVLAGLNILVAIILSGAMLWYLPGIKEICLDPVRRKYRYVYGSILHSSANFGDWDDINGVFIRPFSSRRFYGVIVGISLKSKVNSLPILGIFKSQESAREFAKNISENLSLPLITGDMQIDKIRRTS